MNKRIRRWSIGLAALVCLQGFALSATDEVPQSTLVQKIVVPTPETKQTEVPSKTANASTTTAALHDSGSAYPTQEPEATKAPAETPVPLTEPSELPKPTADLPNEETPTPSEESTAEPAPNPTEESTAEPAPNPTEEATAEPTQTPSAEATPEIGVSDGCGLAEHIHNGECYDEAQNLICEIPEHLHDENCSPSAEATPELPAEEEDQSAEDVYTENELVIAPRVDERLWRGVKPSDERGMAIPMLFQGDYSHVVCTVDGIERSVATSGCGATSLSMVIAYLTGNTEQNPYTLFCDSVDAGCYHGSGWSHETLSRYASDYGVHSRWISNDAETILEALRQGKPVIAHMGPGIFTNRGHYLVLRGLTEEGLVLMNDPASRSNCAKAFPIETLLKQAKTEGSFMICWSDDMPVLEKTEEKAPKSATLWGDLNGSGSVDINDVQMLYALLSSGQADETCDINGDGVVDQMDLDALLEKVMNPEIDQPEKSEGGDVV